MMSPKILQCNELQEVTYPHTQFLCKQGQDREKNFKVHLYHNGDICFSMNT